jgi:hypothetical protein
LDPSVEFQVKEGNVAVLDSRLRENKLVLLWKHRLFLFHPKSKTTCSAPKRPQEAYLLWIGQAKEKARLAAEAQQREEAWDPSFEIHVKKRYTLLFRTQG